MLPKYYIFLYNTVLYLSSNLLVHISMVTVVCAPTYRYDTEAAAAANLSIRSYLRRLQRPR